MSLDIKTIIFLSSIAAIVMGIIILVTAQTYPQIKGVTKWAWGCGAQSIAWMLIYLNGEIPIFFSNTVAYTLLLLSMVLFYQALLNFKEKHFSKRIYYPLIGVAFLLFVTFTFIYPSAILRVITIALIGSVLAFLCSFLLIFKDGFSPNISERLMGFGFFVIGLSPVITLLSIFLNVYQFTDIFPIGIIQNVNFAFIFVSLLILTSSFMLMINDKFMSEILRLATMDSLTEVYNRAAMEKLIEKEIDRSKRYDLPMSLLLLDLDLFKKVNDTYGHQVGDFALKKLVQTITKVLRDPDSLGRFGGEEFLILLPETDLVNGNIAAERVREIVEKTPIEAGTKTFNITISIGLATLNPETDDFEELFRRADLGLYKAKQTGRNRVVAVQDKNLKPENSNGQPFDIFKSNPNIEIPLQIKKDLGE